MGLDMYAFTAPKAALSCEVHFKLDDVPEVQELFYWRKHPDLHGWMEDLYRAKGGAALFNCEPVVLTSCDLDDLEDAILNGVLPSTRGFFFGESDGTETQDDLRFIAAARAAIADGKAIIYDSWW